MTVSNTNSVARVVVREGYNQTRIHEYTPISAKVINNGRKKPDEFETVLQMANRCNVNDKIHYIEDVVDLTYCDAIWNFQMSCRDERGYNLDPSHRAFQTLECKGVLAADNCFINGLQYTAINGTKSAFGQFDMSGTNEETAADLCDSINNDDRIPTLPFDIVAVIGTGADDAKIWIYALPAGSAGNAITITSNENLRLEIGNHPTDTFQDGTDNDTAESRFGEANSDKFEGNYYLDFANAGEEITIPTDGQIYQAGGKGIKEKWNLRGQFDIDIWATVNLIPGIGNSTPVLWSQYDGSYGLDIGMYEDGTTGNWYLRVRYGFGSGETILLGTSAKVMEEGVTSDTPRHIRVTRGRDNIIRLYAMGEQDETVSAVVASSLEQPTGDVGGRNPIIFGSDNGGTLDFAGRFHQVKLYSGNILTEIEAQKVLGAKAQPIHMKFGGTVWDKKDKTTTKKVMAQSYSRDLNNFKITLDAITKTSIASVARGAVGGQDAYYTGNFTPELTVDPTSTDLDVENHGSIQGLYVLSTTANQVTQYSLSGNTWDLKTAVEYSPARAFSVNSQDAQPKGLSVNSGVGVHWFMAGDISNKVYHYENSVAHDISSAVHQAAESYDFSAQTTSVQGVEIPSSSPTNMYILDAGKVYWYVLGTGQNPSTAVYQTGKDLDVSGEDSGMRGITMDASGEHIYLVGTTNDKIFHYELSTPYDLGTAVLSDDLDISTELDEPKGITYTGSDDRLIVMDSFNDIAFKYQQRADNSLASANRYGAGEMDDIIRDLINNLDDSFLVRTLTTMPAQWTGSFLADGKFSEVVNMLLVRGDLTYYINARKVMIIEKSVIFSAQQKTNHQFYQLDDTVNTKTTGGQSLGGVAGVFNSYKVTAVDNNDTSLVNEITLLGARDNTGTVRFTNAQDVKEGDTVHSLRINVPQLSNQTDLDAVRDAIISLTNQVYSEYKVEAPIAVHHVRFNHLIKIFNDMLDIDGDVLGFLKVEGIETNYPSGKTVIHVNQFPLTFFELAGTESTQVNGLQSDTAIPIVFIPAS